LDLEFLEQANIQKFKPTISDSILDNTIFLIHFVSSFNPIATRFDSKFFLFEEML
jgi:hypothetical protein